MKILLIHPQLKKYIQPKLPPLGILAVAAVLEKTGHQVEVLDLNITPDELDQALNKKPDFVGLTATTPLVKEAWRLASNIKEKTNVPIILGGAHASALPDESLEKNIDVVVRGEGEETIIELLKKWPKLSGIKGISYKKEGEIVHESPRPPISDLDSLPFPAYHLLRNVEKYVTPQPVITKPMRTLTLVSSRGCPYGCNYCFKGVFGRSWRGHSAEYILNLWQYLVDKFKVECVGVEDDCFNLSPQRVREVCRGLIDRGIKTYWTTAQGMRADKSDRETLKLMKQAGLFRTAFGIEAGSQEMIEIIGKSLDLKKVEQAINDCKDLKIECIGYFMIGNYGENKKRMQQTIDLAIKLSPDLAHFTTTVPLPGSPLFEIIKQKGKFIIKDWDLYGYTRGRCYFEIGEVKKDLVESMWRKAYRSFYLRPGMIFRLLRKKSTWLSLPNFIKVSMVYLGLRKS